MTQIISRLSQLAATLVVLSPIVAPGTAAGTATTASGVTGATTPPSRVPAARCEPSGRVATMPMTVPAAPSTAMPAIHHASLLDRAGASGAGVGIGIATCPTLEPSVVGLGPGGGTGVPWCDDG